MTKVVQYQRQGRIGVITVDNPPVNALGHAVRSGILEAVEEGLRDGEAKALVLVGAGRTFMAGADIREFGKPPQPPVLGEVIAKLETIEKPIVAAIHGTALGGGLELAFGCHYRVAVESARVGLPEVKLGILPGAGGTQRLPRLTGVEKALEMITTGEPITAAEALDLGVVDAVEPGRDPLPAGIAFAERVVDEGMALRRIRDMDDKVEAARKDPAVFDAFRKGLEKRARGLIAPFRCVDAVEASVTLPFDEGLKRERELFKECHDTPQRQGMIHTFFGERAVARVPGLAKDTPVRKVEKVAVIGAGTMGGGIAMNFANVGIPVVLLESEQAALDKGLATIRRNYENTAKKGRITSADVEKRMGLITPTLSYDDIADVDLVIEAVFENMEIKKEIFARLDQVAKKGAILATNTSTLDIDEIASATKRPQDVVGMHFFSPANVMRLLENVRGRKTADDVLASVMAVSKRIGKVGVMVGVCDGFVGNRMLFRRGQEANALVDAGAAPQDVDKVLTEFGFPMGQFAMSDLAGLDVSWRIREGKRQAGDNTAPARNWLDTLVEAGRHGQKTGAGVFRYEKGDRTPRPDPEVETIIAEDRKARGIAARDITDQEILERTLYVMVNEGAKILEEGIAARPVDIDMVWVYGYGFPAYRGGPMFWADQIGLDKVLAAIEKYQREVGGEQWKPSPLLARLAREGKGFADLEAERKAA